MRLKRVFCVPDAVSGRAFSASVGFAGRAAVLVLLAALAVPSLRAEYVVLRNGLRLRVTGYQLLGDKYRLQMAGGAVMVAAEDVLKIEPEDIFAPLPAPAQAEASQPVYRNFAEAAAKRYNMDADLIMSVIAVESNFDPKAVSSKNARGLMQLLPETAARLGVQNVFDPQENIDAGARYLRELLQKYNNDLALALAAYNAGPERVQQYGGNVPPFAETISYVSRVKRGYEQNKSKASTKTPPTSGATSSTTPPPLGATGTTPPPRPGQPTSQPQPQSQPQSQLQPRGQP